MRTTLHKRFGYPICNIKLDSEETQIIKDAVIIIKDEASMEDNRSTKCLDDLLKALIENDLPFGGKLIISIADFCQILPVIPHGNQMQMVASTLKNRDIWKHFTVSYLQQNIKMEKLKCNETPKKHQALDLGGGMLPTVCVGT